VSIPAWKRAGKKKEDASPSRQMKKPGDREIRHSGTTSKRGAAPDFFLEKRGGGKRAFQSLKKGG